MTAGNLRLNARLQQRMTRFEAKAYHVELVVVVAGAELDAWNQAHSQFRGELGVDLRPAGQRVVVGDGSQAHAIGGEQPQQLSGRKLAIGGIAVAVQVDAQQKGL